MPIDAASTPRAMPILLLTGFGVSSAPTAFAQIEFGVPDRHQLAVGAGSAAITDIDGDSWRDVVICERMESIIVFRNQGDGTLERLYSLYEPARAYNSIQAADLDRDGDPDLAWLSSHGIVHSLRVWYNRGDGLGGRFAEVSLSRPGAGLVVADVSGDGLSDLIVTDARGGGSMARVFRNEGTSFVPGPSAALPFINNLSPVAGDLDGDGDTDLAVLSLDDEHDYMYGWKLDQSQVWILFNDGTGTFPEGRPVPLPFGGGSWGEDLFPHSLRLGDLDGDGDLDMAVAATARDYGGLPLSVVLLENLGDGRQFSRRLSMTMGESLVETHVLLNDMDTDGDLDLAMSAWPGIWVAENSGSFAFREPHRLPDRFPNGRSVLAADLGSDGQSDLVVAGSYEFVVARNMSPYTGPVLDHSVLKRGRPATMTVTDAQPGERVYFLYSREGAGNSVGIRQLGGITLDLVDPIQLIGSAVADANGVAELTITIPPNAPLTTVVMQAVIRRGPGGDDSVKTPFRTARIQP